MDDLSVQILKFHSIPRKNFWYKLTRHPPTHGNRGWQTWYFLCADIHILVISSKIFFGKLTLHPPPWGGGLKRLLFFCWSGYVILIPREFLVFFWKLTLTTPLHPYGDRGWHTWFNFCEDLYITCRGWETLLICYHSGHFMQFQTFFQQIDANPAPWWLGFLKPLCWGFKEKNGLHEAFFVRWLYESLLWGLYYVCRKKYLKVCECVYIYVTRKFLKPFGPLKHQGLREDPRGFTKHPLYRDFTKSFEAPGAFAKHPPPVSVGKMCICVYFCMYNVHRGFATSLCMEALWNTPICVGKNDWNVYLCVCTKPPLYRVFTKPLTYPRGFVHKCVYTYAHSWLYSFFHLLALDRSWATTRECSWLPAAIDLSSLWQQAAAGKKDVG